MGVIKPRAVALKSDKVTSARGSWARVGREDLVRGGGSFSLTLRPCVTHVLDDPNTA